MTAAEHWHHVCWIDRGNHFKLWELESASAVVCQRLAEDPVAQQALTTLRAMVDPKRERLIRERWWVARVHKQIVIYIDALVEVRERFIVDAVMGATVADLEAGRGYRKL